MLTAPRRGAFYRHNTASPLVYFYWNADGFVQARGSEGGMNRVIDRAEIAAVLVVLVLVHLLADSVRKALVMDYGSESVLTAYTTQFVHADW